MKHTNIFRPIVLIMKRIGNGTTVSTVVARLKQTKVIVTYMAFSCFTTDRVAFKLFNILFARYGYMYMAMCMIQSVI